MSTWVEDLPDHGTKIDLAADLVHDNAHIATFEAVALSYPGSGALMSVFAVLRTLEPNYQHRRNVFLELPREGAPEHLALIATALWAEADKRQPDMQDEWDWHSQWDDDAGREYSADDRDAFDFGLVAEAA
jgi:hypothetical protein